MILYLRGLPVWAWYWRAILIANSFASEPPLANLTVVNCSGVMLEQELGELAAPADWSTWSARRRRACAPARRRRRRSRRRRDRVDGEDPGEAVDVLLAEDIPDPDALAPLENQRVLPKDFIWLKSTMTRAVSRVDWSVTGGPFWFKLHGRHCTAI